MPQYPPCLPRRNHNIKSVSKHAHEDLSNYHTYDFFLHFRSSEFVLLLWSRFIFRFRFRILNEPICSKHFAHWTLNEFRHLNNLMCIKKSIILVKHCYCCYYYYYYHNLSAVVPYRTFLFFCSICDIFICGVYFSNICFLLM